MNNTDQLSKWMTLDANISTKEIESRFEQIAKMLFESFAIQKGEKKYLFKEIEFYFYNKNHRDIITHPRESDALRWYVNDFGGIDLNFKSKINRENRVYGKRKNVLKYVLDDSAFFGGILIRQLVEKGSGEVLNGPLACAEIFRWHNAIETDKDFPKLIEHDNGKASYQRKVRTNILRAPQNDENIRKKVDNILYSYHEYPDKEELYKEFEEFKDKLYGFKR